MPPSVFGGGGPGSPRALREYALCDGLSLHQTSILRRYCEFHKYADGAELFTPEKPADGCYLILEGAVQLTDVISDGAEYGPGHMIGELSLLGNDLPPATAVATGATHVARFTRDSLAHLEQDNPRLAAEILVNVSVMLGRRFRWLNAALADLPSEDSGEYQVEPGDGGES